MRLACEGAQVDGEAPMKDNARMAYAAALIGGVLLWVATATVSGRIRRRTGATP